MKTPLLKTVNKNNDCGRIKFAKHQNYYAEERILRELLENINLSSRANVSRMFPY